MAILLVAMVPLTVDLFMSYASARDTEASVLKFAEARKIDAAQFTALLTEIRESPLGIPGLARSTIALTVLVVLGVAVVHILVVIGGDTASSVESVLTLLGGILATIVGFYFSGRTAAPATQPAKGGRLRQLRRASRLPT